MFKESDPEAMDSAPEAMDSAPEARGAQLNWLRISMVFVPLLGLPLLVVYILASHGSNRFAECDLAPEVANLIARSGTWWRNAAIDASIDFFGRGVSLANVLYALLFVQYWANYYGWMVTAKSPVNLTECIGAGIVLALLNLGSFVLSAYSANNDWITSAC